MSAELTCSKLSFVGQDTDVAHQHMLCMTFMRDNVAHMVCWLSQMFTAVHQEHEGLCRCRGENTVHAGLQCLLREFS